MEAVYRNFPFENRRKGVRKLRKACGLGQCELARAAKVSQTLISLFETGAEDMSKAAFGRVHEVLKRALLAQKVELKKAEKEVIGKKMAARNLVAMRSLVGGSEGLESYWDSVQAIHIARLEAEVLRVRKAFVEFHELFKRGHELTNAAALREAEKILEEISAGELKLV